MIKCIVFDLDQTLADTRILEVLRKNRDWNQVYRMIPQTKVYPGIQELMNHVSLLGIKKTIVTTSPRVYAERVVRYHGWIFDLIVGYHDVQFRKPHPEPMLKVLNYFHLSGNECLALGDRGIDIESANSAGCISVACYWGTEENNLLRNSNPKLHCEKPIQISNYLDDADKKWKMN